LIRLQLFRQIVPAKGIEADSGISQQTAKNLLKPFADVIAEKS
jgi:hypothetical protein